MTHTVSNAPNNFGNAETVSRAVIKPFIHVAVNPFVHIDDTPQSAVTAPQEAPISVPQMSVAPVPVAQMSAPMPDLSTPEPPMPPVKMQFSEANGILETLKANAAERLPADPTGERQQLQAPRGKHYYRS